MILVNMFHSEKIDRSTDQTIRSATASNPILQFKKIYPNDAAATTEHLPNT